MINDPEAMANSYYDGNLGPALSKKLVVNKPTAMGEYTTTMLRCLCCDHAISVDDWSDGEKIISLWSKDTEEHRGRLYWMWKAIKKGYAGSSEIIIDAAATKDLIEALSK